MGEDLCSQDWLWDIAVLEHLAEEYGKRIPENCPLFRWLRAMRLEATRLEALESGRTINLNVAAPHVGAYLVDLYGARLAAWSARSMLAASHHGRIENLEIHGNFVTAELCGPDDTRPDVFAVPAGVATLYIASQCAIQGGASLRIFGSKSQGLDIEWRTRDGGIVRFEVKTTSLYGAMTKKKTAVRLGRQVAQRVAAAGKDLRDRTKTDGTRWPLHVVAHVAFVADVEKYNDVASLEWDDLLITAREGLSRDEIPQRVLLFWWGLGLDGNEFGGRYHYTVLEDDAALPPAPRRAARAFANAFGAVK